MQGRERPGNRFSPVSRNTGTASIPSLCSNDRNTQLPTRIRTFPVIQFCAPSNSLCLKEKKRKKHRLKIRSIAA